MNIALKAKEFMPPDPVLSQFAKDRDPSTHDKGFRTDLKDAEAVHNGPIAFLALLRIVLMCRMP